MTVWVTGAAGMLGQEVVRELEALDGATVIATDREVDITDPAAVDGWWADHGPVDWVVNCAAWTAVDAAEENEEAAKRLNVEGPRVLAATAATHGAAILHISTDYVFSGEGERPYAPDDPTDPRSAYGRTKAEGEDAVRAANPRHIIIRTAWLYGPGGKNFVYTMLRLMAEREEIGVVADQYGVPTYAPDLARVIASVTGGEGGRGGHGDDAVWGTYHYTNAADEEAGISWFGFAETIYTAGRAAGLITTDCRINALTTAEYPTPAARPAYSVLDSSATVRVFGVEQPAWQVSLDEFFATTFRYLDDQRALARLAAYDLETADAMQKAARYLYVAYTCQQAIEKNLKVVITIKARPPRIHDLVSLWDGSGLASFPVDRRLLVELSQYYLRGRYHWDVESLSRRLNRAAAEDLLRRSHELCDTIRRHPIFSII